MVACRLSYGARTAGVSPSACKITTLNGPEAGSDTTGPAGIDIDCVDRTDIDTQHAVDTLLFVCRVRLDCALRVIRGVDPFEDINWTVLKTGTVADTQVEIDGDVSPANALLLSRRSVAVTGPDRSAVLLANALM